MSYNYVFLAAAALTVVFKAWQYFTDRMVSGPVRAEILSVNDSVLEDDVNTSSTDPVAVFCGEESSHIELNNSATAMSASSKTFKKLFKDLSEYTGLQNFFNLAQKKLQEEYSQAFEQLREQAIRLAFRSEVVQAYRLKHSQAVDALTEEVTKDTRIIEGLAKWKEQLEREIAKCKHDCSQLTRFQMDVCETAQVALAAACHTPACLDLSTIVVKMETKIDELTEEMRVTEEHIKKVEDTFSTLEDNILTDETSMWFTDLLKVDTKKYFKAVRDVIMAKHKGGMQAELTKVDEMERLRTEVSDLLAPLKDQFGDTEIELSDVMFEMIDTKVAKEQKLWEELGLQCKLAYVA